jgi:MFS family permease
MALIIFSERGHLLGLHLVRFFNGTVLALSMPARQAFVPELIPDRLIFTAMALNTTGWNLSRILGPGLAGLLIAWVAAGDTSSAFGVGIVYLMIAFLYRCRGHHAAGEEAPATSRRSTARARSPT